MFNVNLPIIETNNHLEITLCGKGSCKCPSIEMDVESDHGINLTKRCHCEGHKVAESILSIEG